MTAMKIQVPPKTSRGQLAPDASAIRQQVGAGTQGQICCHRRYHRLAGPCKRYVSAESDERPPRQKR
jgi:hypothetical protein